MALTDIQKVRLNVGDTDVSFPFLSDDDYTYYLEKNNNSIDKASMDAARAILFQLSTRNQETVDIFSVKNTSADTYLRALQMYISNPNLNPIYTSVQAYAGGISRSDYDSNIDNCDNKSVVTPQEHLERERLASLPNPFLI